MVRRWRLIGYFPILYNPDRGLHVLRVWAVRLVLKTFPPSPRGQNPNPKTNHGTQVRGGDAAANNLWLACSLVDTLVMHAAWLRSRPLLLPAAVYSVLRLLPDAKEAVRKGGAGEVLPLPFLPYRRVKIQGRGR
jgi:hypothetical protein